MPRTINIIGLVKAFKFIMMRMVGRRQDNDDHGDDDHDDETKNAGQ